MATQQTQRHRHAFQQSTQAECSAEELARERSDVRELFAKRSFPSDVATMFDTLVRHTRHMFVVFAYQLSNENAQNRLVIASAKHRVLGVK